MEINGSDALSVMLTNSGIYAGGLSKGPTGL